MFDFILLVAQYTLIGTLFICTPLMLAMYLSNEKTEEHVGIHQVLMEEKE